MTKRWGRTEVCRRSAHGFLMDVASGAWIVVQNRIDLVLEDNQSTRRFTFRELFGCRSS